MPANAQVDGSIVNGDMARNMVEQAANANGGDPNNQPKTESPAILNSLLHSSTADAIITFHAAPSIRRTHHCFPCTLPLNSTFDYRHFTFLSSVPPFSALILSESKSSRDRISKKQPRSPVSCPSGKPPKTKPPRVPHHPHSSYLVVDTTLPSHVFSDCSLFTTYVPLRRLHHTVFGTDIVVEGIGDVEVRIIVNGTSILFRLRDSWHVPSSSHHFLSASRAISLGNQIMIAGRSPRLIFSHNKHLVQPDLPKYMPFT